MDLAKEVRFALAEQILIDTVFENTDKEKVKELMSNISQYIQDLHQPVEVIVAAIYLFHRQHVNKSIEVLDNLPPDKPDAIPPWMQ